MKRDKHKSKKPIIISVSVLAVTCFTAAILLYFSIVQINNPPKDKYPIKGVDVSEYQGGIDWSVLSNRMCLDGYNGEEKYIDMNVFVGTEEEFASCLIVQ